MCLILIAWRTHPRYPLVLAANRDEFFARAAAPAAWWPDAGGLLAGRDLEAGGTWLGVTRGGRIAALTNYRDPGAVRTDAPSRGELVPAMLGDGAVAEALERLHARAAAYNGFNLVLADAAALGVYESVPRRARLLDAGIYGLSNHLLDTPWPKVQSAKSALSEALQHLPDTDALLELLRDERSADDASLPRTGLSLEWERLLSSAFIRAPGYGTRCSTIVLRDRDGGMRFTEWTWDRTGAPAGRVDHSFRIDAGVRSA